MNKYILTLAILLVNIAVFSQTGKEFWFAIPYIDSTHDGNGATLEGPENYFKILAGEAPANVTFYSFQDDSGNPVGEQELFTISVPANSVETVSLTDNPTGSGNIKLTAYTNKYPDSVTNKGVRINSDNPVSIYYEIGSYNNTDIFSLKGKDALGTEFYPVFQNLRRNKLPEDNTGWAIDSWESVDIVATENNTTISYYLPTATAVSSMGPGQKQTFTYPSTPITVNLQKGQTYSIRGTSRDAIKALNGIKITSNKNISITIKDDTVYDSVSGSEAGDVSGDQFVPTSIAGTKYIIPDFNAGVTQGVFIKAIQDGTQISVTQNGTTTIAGTINAGEVFSFDSFDNDDGYILIDTDSKPAMCFQLGGYPSTADALTEFAGAVVPPVDECTGSTQASFNIPQIDKFSVAIISRTNVAGTFQFKIGGSSSWIDYNPSFTDVDIDGNGSPDWYFSIITETNSGDVLSDAIKANPNTSFIVRNQTNTFHLGTLTYLQNGGDRGSFYGYFSDFTSPEIQISFSKETDGQVKLFAFGGVPGSYDWNRINHIFQASPSVCYQSFFTDTEEPATCNKTDNPMYLSTRMLDKDGFYYFSATGQSICSGDIITSTVDIEVAEGIAYLPIELDFFTAVTENGRVKLDWRTLSELNCEYFTIERSEDGKHFTPIARKTGGGTINIPKKYDYTDKIDKNGIYYYRLKQTDYNGDYTYTEIISIAVNTTIESVFVYPTFIDNNQEINIILPSSSEEFQIAIYNAIGKCVYKTNATDTKSTTISPDLPRGIYELIVNDSKNLSSHKILITK